MFKLSRSTIRVLIIFTLIITLMLTGLYILDRSHNNSLTWSNYAEILGGYVVLWSVIPAIDFSTNVGIIFRQKRSAHSFFAALAASAFVGLLAAAAFLLFTIIIAGVFPTTAEISDVIIQEWRFFIILFCISIAFTWIITITTYFESRNEDEKQ